MVTLAESLRKIKQKEDGQQNSTEAVLAALATATTEAAKAKQQIAAATRRIETMQSLIDIAEIAIEGDCEETVKMTRNER